MLYRTNLCETVERNEIHINQHDSMFCIDAHSSEEIRLINSHSDTKIKYVAPEI